MSCRHERIKKNWPFGRKSKPTLKCKDCGDALKRSDLPKKKGKQRRRQFK